MRRRRASRWAKSSTTRVARHRPNTARIVAPAMLCATLFVRLLGAGFARGDDNARSSQAASPPVQPAVVEPNSRYFGIRVLDDVTGRGVPLVELRTVHELRQYTDSAGYVAFLEPDLMGREVFFYVSSPGYEFPADGFGYRGKKLRVEPGKIVELKIKRLNRAERLYRTTGGGVYADSQRLGMGPKEGTNLPGWVLGSDSVVAAVHRGRIHWFWGDTLRPEYPLGNFHVPGAISPPREQHPWSPDSGVVFDYFVDARGRAKETARMPGDGPTWIGGMASLPDRVSPEKTGRDHLLAAYEKIKPPLTVAARGVAEFDEQASEFRSLITFPVDRPLRPHGHVVRHVDDRTEYCYFGDPFPWTRTAATRTGYLDLDAYEGYTALDERNASGEDRVARDDAGRLVFAWRRGARPWTYETERRLVSRGLMREEETLVRLVDPDGDLRVVPHRGSVNWNDYRQRWIAIFGEIGGSSSNLGEIWYAESERIEGPWTGAVKVVTHEKYSFYNPRHHAFLDEEGGRVIYFEGTYTRTFSGSGTPTPRYEYNQIMYRLKL